MCIALGRSWNRCRRTRRATVILLIKRRPWPRSIGDVLAYCQSRNEAHDPAGTGIDDQPALNATGTRRGHAVDPAAPGDRTERHVA